MVENILPDICGSSNWKEDICSKPVSETDAIPSDMAFGILTYENMMDKWQKQAQGTEVPKSEKGKYTSSGSNRKYGGWSIEGLCRYGDLYRNACRNGHRRWAKDVEMEVMISLKACHYSAVTVEMIHTSNTKKQKRQLKNHNSAGSGGNDDEDGRQAPMQLWRVDGVNEEDVSSSKEEEWE